VTLDEIKYCREDVAATLRLLNAQRREYETYPISLQPERAMSPASLAKSFKESMGLAKPSVRFHLPDWVHGVAMQSYYGGRSEVRIRDVELPVARSFLHHSYVFHPVLVHYFCCGFVGGYCPFFTLVVNLKLINTVGELSH
jgi:hypothetical protein